MFFSELGNLGTWPQYILYTKRDAARFDRLRKEGYFGTRRPFALIVLGRHPESEEGSAAGLNRFLGKHDAGVGDRVDVVQRHARRRGPAVEVNHDTEILSQRLP